METTIYVVVANLGDYEAGWSVNIKGFTERAAAEQFLASRLADDQLYAEQLMRDVVHRAPWPSLTSMEDADTFVKACEEREARILADVTALANVLDHPLEDVLIKGGFLNSTTGTYYLEELSVVTP